MRLLPLVRHLDRLFAAFVAFLTKQHTSRILFGGNSARLGLVLDERQATAWHHAYFAEALEAAEDPDQAIGVDIARQILQEQCLVWRQVLVGY